MKIKKILAFLAILILIFANKVQAVTPEITATSAAVIECLDEKILYSKSMDEKVYPASLTKILTAIVVLDNCNINDTITVTQSAIDSVEYGYLTANIKAGEELTVEQLLNILLISSCNDVANVLAESVGGNIENFVVMMNEKAKEIGCTNSNFINCSGEHNENHYSSAHDLALIGKCAMEYGEIKNIVKKISYKLESTNLYQKEDRLYETSNEMLLSGSNNYCSYAYGIKTGFTTPAGNCLMVYTLKNDIPLVTVVMKSTTSNSRYDDARSAFKYAYDNNTLRNVVSAGTNLQTVNVKNGTTNTKKLNAVLKDGVVAVVNDENLKTNYEPQITINESLKAPIAKGEKVGSVVYEIEGKVYTRDLIAESEVKKSKTGLIMCLIFIGLIVLFGGLRIISISKRSKTLKKIRNKIK